MNHSDGYFQINALLHTAQGLALDLSGKGLEPSVAHLADALVVVLEKARQLAEAREVEAMQQERQAA